MPAPDDELRRLAGDRLRALLPALEQVQDSLSVPGQSEDQIREHGYASIAAAVDRLAADGFERITLVLEGAARAGRGEGADGVIHTVHAAGLYNRTSITSFVEAGMTPGVNSSTT